MSLFLYISWVRYTYYSREEINTVSRNTSIQISVEKRARQFDPAPFGS